MAMKRSQLKPGKPLRRGKPIQAKRKKRKPKSKLQTRKDKVSSNYWLKRADVLWSVLVRQKNGGRCVMCGKPCRDAHHIIPRGKKAHRHNLKNGLPLCYPCHQCNNSVSPHQSPLGFVEWLKEYNLELFDWADYHRHDLYPYPDFKAAYEALAGLALDDVLDREGQE
ncbi:hypothetical protein LCGC14_3168490 [marine sediment metagenome]|uniref:HNH nuclease domain-containing protein n=1 Tax=marine sediment metagenome TaxID=412755 RepID=A0A0F8VG35_9ZZZZ